MYRAEEFAFAGVVFDQALVEIDGSFLGFYDIQQGYLCRWFRQIKATANPTLGAYDAVLDQWLEYFGKKGWCDILCLADIFFENDFPGRLAGHIENGTDGVFCRSSNNQGNPFC